MCAFFIGKILLTLYPDFKGEFSLIFLQFCFFQNIILFLLTQMYIWSHIVLLLHCACLIPFLATVRLMCLWHLLVFQYRDCCSALWPVRVSAMEEESSLKYGAGKELSIFPLTLSIEGCGKITHLKQVLSGRIPQCFKPVCYCYWYFSLVFISCIESHRTTCGQGLYFCLKVQKYPKANKTKVHTKKF